jgi:predicted Zn-dependent peptidase
MPEMYDYSLDFYRRHYRPENVVLVLAGDFDTEEAKRLIREHYADWAPGYVPPAIPVEPRQTAPRDSLVVYPGRTLPILSINYKAPAWSATDTMAVALEVLGRAAFGPNSELNRRLVLQERRAQYLSAGVRAVPGPGARQPDHHDHQPGGRGRGESGDPGGGGAVPDRAGGPATLDAVKSNMKYGFLMGLEEAQGIAFSLIPFVINTGTVEAVEDYFRTLDAVTPEHMREAARRYLVPEGAPPSPWSRRRADDMRERSTRRRSWRPDALVAACGARHRHGPGRGRAGRPGSHGTGGAEAPRLITLPEPESPFIAFNIWVRTGSQDDPPGKEGLAALTASLMASGGHPVAQLRADHGGALPHGRPGTARTWTGR